MQPYKYNWFYRVLRNTAEVSSDGGTVVIRETPEVVEVPAAPSVGETLGAAAAVVEMAAALNDSNTAPDRQSEMIALLSEIRDDMRALRANQSAPAPVIVEVETPEPEDEPVVVKEPEVIVNTGELTKEVIEPISPIEDAPKKRKSRFF